MLKHRQVQQFPFFILEFWVYFVLLFCWKLFLILFSLLWLSSQRMYQVILLTFFLSGKFLYKGFLDNVVTIRMQHNFLRDHMKVIINSLLNSDKMNIFFFKLDTRFSKSISSIAIILENFLSKANVNTFASKFSKLYCNLTTSLKKKLK